MAMNLLNLADRVKDYLARRVPFTPQAKQAWSPVVEKAKPYAQNVVQPTIQVFKQGVPALGRISAQTNPLIRTQLKSQPQLQQQLQPQKGDIMKTARMGVTGYGLTKLQPVSAFLMAALGGGISKVTGGKFMEGASKGLGQYPQIAGTVGLTDPLISRGFAKFLPKAGTVAKKGVSAIANVLQGLGVDVATKMPTTPTSIGLDVATGALFGPTQFDTPRIKGLELTQKGKIPEPQLPGRVKAPEGLPQVRAKPELGKVDVPLKPIISQKDKYAFNINKPKLGLKGKAAKKLDEVVEKMRPVLETRKGKPLTDNEIIKGGRKAQILDSVMSRKESAEFSNALQASRNFLRTRAKKKGLTPEFLAQIEIVSSHASDKGRSLRAFAVDAENAGIKEAVVRDLQKLGIETKRLIEASKNVDWDDASQVTEFYRKFKPADFAEKLQEYRYVNMLSSPNTHIVNTFSNFIQSAVVAPVEKTLTGGIDFVRARLTGTEQKYFARQGVDYAKGYWKNLPEAWRKFKQVMGGEGGLLRPDIDFIPTGTSKFHKLYTTPLRALEASDQFFRTLIIGGEKQALKLTKLIPAQITKNAGEIADLRLFRQKFDPQGKLGQGGLLKLWDKWNVGVNQLRRLPGGKWIVPFLQTPTNILKQGVEYSPLGVATIPGAREPMEQLSKAIIGSSVFVGAYSLANSGLITWDAPISSKERSEFYAAGLQPYSVKIGDKWVSYSKIGPLSYPIAMAAAMKWAKDNGASDNFLKTVGMGMGGFLQFFADQSYMQGIGDVIDAVRGDEFKQGRALANIPSQLIPYRALQGWFARLIDPIYRKSTGGGVGGQMVKSMMTQIPFMSKKLEPYTTPSGELSERHFPLINAFSPARITQEQPEEMEYYKGKQKIRGLKREAKILEAKKEKGEITTVLPSGLPTTFEDLSTIYKTNQSAINSYEEKKAKIQYGDYTQPEKELKLIDLEEDYKFAQDLVKKIESEKPEQVFEIQLDTYKSGGGMKVKERAEWAAKQLQKGKITTTTTAGDGINPLIKKYFPQDQWANAQAVMMGESGGKASAVGDNYPIRGQTIPSYGLFQIRALPGRPSSTQLQNPEFNVKYAAEMYKREGWSPWTAARNLGIVGGGQISSNKQQQIINQFWDSGVLTTGKKGTAQYLKDNLGIDVYSYTGSDTDIKKKLLAKVKSAKKVTFKKVSAGKISAAEISFKKPGKITPIKKARIVKPKRSVVKYSL